MNLPPLKGEVSRKEKMASETNPRLKRIDLVPNSLHNFIANFTVNNIYIQYIQNNILGKLNLEDGNSSLCIKAEVSLPPM